VVTRGVLARDYGSGSARGAYALPNAPKARGPASSAERSAGPSDSGLIMNSRRAAADGMSLYLGVHHEAGAGNGRPMPGLPSPPA
jgi:hypothetical protein